MSMVEVKRVGPQISLQMMLQLGPAEEEVEA
jgi:hypothetical protein